MTKTAEKSSEQLRREWVEHPYFRYRRCAPDPDQPLRMVGNPELHVGAHNGPDAWNPEGQRERRAREEKAIKVCEGCAVRVQCDAYASSVTPEGRIAEPEGVWGGRRGLERRRAFEDRQKGGNASPTRRLRTAQKLAVLRALAVCWDPFEVAAAAGVDVRTANWQRSNIVTHLGLARKATRAQLLAAAAERGLLEGLRVIPDDGTVPAIPPPTKLMAPQQLPMWSMELFQASAEAGHHRPARGIRAQSMRSKFQRVSGQGDLAVAEPEGLAEVHEMFPVNARLEAAA